MTTRTEVDSLGVSSRLVSALPLQELMYAHNFISFSLLFFLNIFFRPWDMNRVPIDDEAPKDPGAHHTHSTYSEKDFEGDFSFPFAKERDGTS